MKIGIILPVGDLTTFGYFHHARTIVANHLAFADQVIVMSSSRNTNEKTFESNSHLRVLSNEKTWFPLHHEHELFGFAALNNNINAGRDVLRQAGADIAIEIHINQYIPKASVPQIRHACERMLSRKKPYTWLYKKYQLLNWIFHADTRLPWIYNLTVENPYDFDADSLKHRMTSELVRITTDNFSRHDNEAIVDVIGENTLLEAQKKHEFMITELRKLNGTFNPYNSANLQFDQDVYMSYHQQKINQKSRSREMLDPTGQRVYENSQSEFLSHTWQNQYRAIKRPWYARLMIKTRRDG